MTTLYVANTIPDLAQGDIDEHLPIRSIPLTGDIVGLGTTTSFDNGELSFIYNHHNQCTNIYKSNPASAAAEYQDSTSETIHFPYVSYTSDASNNVIRIPNEELPEKGDRLQPLLASIIENLDNPSDYFGIRLRASWQSLVITVASKLCFWQQRRYNQSSLNLTAQNIYGNLKHFKLGGNPSSEPHIHHIGPVSDWLLSGFYARHPETGLVTVPQVGQNLHIHGCSYDLSQGGHVHHEHPETVLFGIRDLALYPITRVQTLKADLTVQNAAIANNTLSFEVNNIGQLDASNVDIDIVANNSYSGKQFLRLPWLAAHSSQILQLDLHNLPLQSGPNTVDIVVDPNRIILEDVESNNACSIIHKVP